MNALAACCRFSIFIGSFLYQRAKPPQRIALFINLLGKGLTPRACMGDQGSISWVPVYDRNDPSYAAELSQTATIEMNDNNCMYIHLKRSGTFIPRTKAKRELENPKKVVEFPQLHYIHIAQFQTQRGQFKCTTDMYALRAYF